MGIERIALSVAQYELLCARHSACLFVGHARQSDEQARGVPRALQLILRDAHGTARDPHLLALRAMQCPADPRPPEWAALPPGAIVDGWVWHMLAAFEVAEP